MIAETAIATISGGEAALLVSGATIIVAILGVAVVRARHHRAASASGRLHRPPSPASVGLDDDPIVAALIGSRPDALPRGHTVPLSGEGDPLT